MIKGPFKRVFCNICGLFFTKKRPGKEIDTIMRKILIVGGGNLGYFLSQALMEDGYSVSLIEKEKEYCRRVANLLDIPVICGDGTMVETLARGGGGSVIR